MSTKMSVQYGVNPGSITDVPLDDCVVAFFVKDDEDKQIGVRSFNFAELARQNKHRAFLYGCNKLVTDRTSEEKNKLAKLHKMQEVFDLLVSGEWAKERVVGAVVVSAAVEALAQMEDMTIADTQAALAQYDKETRTSILQRSDVMELAKEISAARKDAPRKTLDDMIPAK